MGIITRGICPVGNHPFEYELLAGKRRTYCSQEHAWKASNQRAIVRNGALSERHCPKCEQTKPSKEFAGPTAAYCRPCTAKWARERRAAGKRQSPEYSRKATLERYGLTLERFSEMLTAQGGQCKICRTEDPGLSGWQVDHDHTCCNTRKKSCGKCLRGILCSHCNIGIGNLRDDPDIIRAALQYVLDYRARLKAHSSSTRLPDVKDEG